MARVYGVKCEACGKLDIGSADQDLYEDQFPRAGWISVTLWVEDALAGPEHTVCSQQCLNFFSFMTEDFKEEADEDDACCSPSSMTSSEYY